MRQYTISVGSNVKTPRRSTNPQRKYHKCGSPDCYGSCDATETYHFPHVQRFLYENAVEHQILTIV